MKYFDWSEEKNEWLQGHRGISFELCLAYIQSGYVLDDLENTHPRQHQRVLIVNIEGYAYRVPYVEDEEKIFLKTIYPSRIDTKRYLSDQ